MTIHTPHNYLPVQGELSIKYFMVRLGDEGLVDEDGEPVYMLVRTNEFLNDLEKEGYEQSISTRRPSEGGRIIAIDAGPGYIFPILENLAREGKIFRATSLSHKAFRAMMDEDPDFIKRKVLRNNLAWATPGYSHYVQVKNDPRWGAEVLGLDMVWSEKLGKRNQEVLRSVRAYAICDDLDDLWIVNVDGADFMHVNLVRETMVKDRIIVALVKMPGSEMIEVGVDGMMAMSSSFAHKIGLKLASTNNMAMVRILTAIGEIKGACMVLPDEWLNGADMVVPECNVKRNQLGTNDGRTIIMAWEHKSFSRASYNYQSRIIQPAFHSLERIARDMGRMQGEIEQIISSGDLPDWILTDFEPEGEEGIRRYDSIEDQTKSYQRWQTVADIRASQSFLTMALMGLANRMEKGYHRGYYKRMFVPISNAFHASYTSHASWEMLTTADTGHDGKKAYFMPGYGVVMPTHRFFETFELHGTHDSDDTADFMLIKVWSSNAKYTELLKADGIIDKAIDIPSTPEDAIHAVAMIRLPNSQGEYSIEFFDNVEDLPWFGAHEDIEAIDLAALPRGIDHLTSLVEMSGMPKDTIKYGGKFQPKHAIYMIEAQLTNPGIGGVANALMCCAHTMGIKFPAKMLDKLGEMIDAVQQRCNKKQFAAVAAEAGNIMTQVIEYMEEHPEVTMDKCINATRQTSPQHSVPKERLVVGDETLISSEYRKLYNNTVMRLRQHTKETRQASTLAKWVLSLHHEHPEYFSDLLQGWTKEFTDRYQQRLKDISDELAADVSDNKFRRILKSYERSDAMTLAVKDMKSEFSQWGEQEQYRRVMALYLWCVLPRRDGLGIFDRVLFQNGAGGEMLADILIDALGKMGAPR